MLNTIIDSHAHLSWDSFKEDQITVIERAQQSGVIQIVQAGVDFTSLADQLAIAEQYNWIYNGVGLHPHEAKHWTNESKKLVHKWCQHQSVVAIGECGLDFYYNHSTRSEQEKAFRQQIKIAKDLSLPLIIHTRDAWQETFDILFSEGGSALRGVFHCFTGSPEHLPLIQELGFYLSFSGILTFKTAELICEVAKMAPQDKILVETDSPYLAPQGQRGKRNEPSFIWLTAEKLAHLRQDSLENIAKLTSSNARILFKLPEPES